MPRIVLIGLYKLGYLSLQELLGRKLDLVGVVTKRESGIEEEPLATLARERGLPLLLPSSPREAGFFRRIKGLRPDLIVVAGYHRLLPKKLLALPTLGVLNLHGSLLPRHRGPVPWKWSILQGETRTGMTVQQMSPGLDEGPILAQEPCPILPDDTGETLIGRMCDMGGPLLARTILRYVAGELEPRPQDEARATYEGYPTEDDAHISWDWDAERIRNLIRGLAPRPGAWMSCQGTKVRVGSSILLSPDVHPVPGEILRIEEHRMVVATGAGTLSIGNLARDTGELLAPADRRRLGLVPGAKLDRRAPAAETSIPRT